MSIGHALDIGSGRNPDPRAEVRFDWYPYSGVSVVGSVLHLPFRDGSFDLVTAHEVLEHLPPGGRAGADAVYRTCDEAWRVLRPGGTFELDVPHVEGPAAFADPTHRRFFVPSAFEWLWNAQRDPLYPRHLWNLLTLRVSRSFRFGPINDWHIRKHAPRLYRVLERLRIGHPGYIFLRLQKPGDLKPEAPPAVRTYS